LSKQGVWVVDFGNSVAVVAAIAKRSGAWYRISLGRLTE
jgi:hypothetical protein